MNNNLLEYACINDMGAVMLGKNTVVDGYHHGREIGVFTHIHSDHTKYFVNALHECIAIYVSRPTYDLLAALEANNTNVSMDTFFKGRHIHALDFETPILPNNDRKINSTKIYYDEITLFEAHHILGSSQVLAITSENKRVVYSGDFAHPKTKSIKCDVLVLDSTHGDPMFNAPVEPKSLENRLVQWVEHEIENGNPVCIRAHAGRLQYVMSILSSKIASNIPFLTANENFRLIPVYKKYGMKIRDNVICTNQNKCKSEDILKGSFPFIEFKKTSESKSLPELDNKSAVFYLGGVNLGPHTTIKQSTSNPKHYIIEFGDHATYDGILDYVKKCSPQLVITDRYRSKWGDPLAKRITKSLGIDAVSQP